MNPKLSKLGMLLRVNLVAWTVILAGGLASVVRAEGNGVKFGDARLHPFFDFESHYDSGALVVTNSSGQPETKGDLALHFKPGVKLDVPSPTFAVNLNGNLDYVLFTDVAGEGTRDASHLAGEGLLDLTFNSEGQIGLAVGDHARRSDSLENAPVITQGALSFYNDAYLKLFLRPAGGSLTIEPGYRFESEVFSPLGNLAVGTFDQYDYTNHSFALSGSWKFLPKTALKVESTYGVRSYLKTGGTPINTLNALLGLVGQVTTHFATALRLGWGQDLTTKSFSGLIGQAEIGYIPSETASVKLGYTRLFQPSGPPFVAYGDDRISLSGQALLGGQLTLHATGALDFINYRYRDGVGRSQADKSASVDLGLDYQLKAWVVLGGGYQYSYGTREWANASSYDRHDGYVRVQFIY